MWQETAGSDSRFPFTLLRRVCQLLPDKHPQPINHNVAKYTSKQAGFYLFLGRYNVHTYSIFKKLIYVNHQYFKCNKSEMLQEELWQQLNFLAVPRNTHSTHYVAQMLHIMEKYIDFKSPKKLPNICVQLFSYERSEK